MSRVGVRLVLLLAMAFGGAALSHAHHSGAMYDRLQSITVECNLENARRFIEE